MSYSNSLEQSADWKNYEKAILRFLFIFFVVLSFPLLDYRFYQQIFSSGWNIHDIIGLVHYLPQFIAQDQLPRWGIGSFANFSIAAIIALAGAIIWGLFAKGKQDYRRLYYWLRTILRYKLALGLIAYGLIKLFPLQIPFPTLSDLHTKYGDFYPWKIYFLTLGITPSYESFLGFVEILTGFLLFFRKTATFGAGIALGFLGNVLMVNIFYEVGEHVYSTFLLLLALFIFSFDVPRLYQLLIKRKRTLANTFHPVFVSRSAKIRSGLRLAFVLFSLTLGITAYTDFKKGSYLLPRQKGLTDSYGFYNVKEFILNHDTLPYSLSDSNRWQNVVFEKWSTLSIDVPGTIITDQSNGEGPYATDADKDYELAGASGRHYYHYDADTVAHTLALQNKNKNHAAEHYAFVFSRPDSGTIILQGTNERSDSVYAVLEKVDKKYLLLEGRRKPIKL